LEALGSDAVNSADVALLDLALGSDTLTGVDLALALRNRNPNIGIVIHSQHPLKSLAENIPATEQMGWSFLAKSGTLKTEELVSLLKSTASGMSHLRLTPKDGSGENRNDVNLQSLTSSQRVAMSLASIGLTAPEIADQMNISAESVRQHLSKAYKTLVPEPGVGSDMRTKAVLAYVALVESVTEGVR
jgi:DNA-binding NarL/FixJ family response regulator